MKDLAKAREASNIKYSFKCRFCNREFFTRKSAFHYHENRCSENPNKLKTVLTSKQLNHLASLKELHTNPEKSIKRCEFCGREFFTTKAGITIHQKGCVQSPNCKIKQQKARKSDFTCCHCGKHFSDRFELAFHKKQHLSRSENEFLIYERHKISQTCRFCGRIKITTKGGNTLHEKHCYENPNRVKGHSMHWTEEQKQKIANGARKAQAEGRAHSWWMNHKTSFAEGYWKDVFKDNENIVYNFRVGYYVLDFANLEKKVYFEVDGEQHYTEEGLAHDKERTETLEQQGWKLVSRCRWSLYQKLQKIERENYVSSIKKLLY